MKVRVSKDYVNYIPIYTKTPDYVLEALGLKLGFLLMLLKRISTMRRPNFSVKYHAKLFRVKWETLNSWLKKLEEKGYINIIHNKVGTNDYELLKEPIPPYPEEIVKDVLKDENYPKPFKLLIQKVISYMENLASDNRIVYPTPDILKDTLNDVYKYWKKGTEYRTVHKWKNHIEYLLSIFCEEWVSEGQLTLLNITKYIKNHWERAQALNLLGKYNKSKKILQYKLPEYEKQTPEQREKTRTIFAELAEKLFNKTKSNK